MPGIRGRHFIDEAGRRLNLRGVNLAGSSKMPLGSSSHDAEAFSPGRVASFVGRPFPLEEADRELARIRDWGFGFVRLLVLWEGLEGKAPGLYDEAYLDYLGAVVKKAAARGLLVLLDLHQDIWGRPTGGDGAPLWTYEAVGMDPRALGACGAAVVQNGWKGSFPRMIWPTNYAKLGAATMFTLFFGGAAFAPRLRIEGRSAQDWLQERYCAAAALVAGRLGGLPGVIGLDLMNEPSRGYIGQELSAFAPLLRMGPSPSPLQSFALGAGMPQRVPVVDLTRLGYRRRGEILIDPAGRRAWLPGHDCPWKAEGVWDLDSGEKPALLRPRHFAEFEGRAVDFPRDCMRPFVLRLAAAVSAAAPGLPLVAERNLEDAPPPLAGELPGRLAYAPHWYDELTHFTKEFSPRFTVDVPRKRPVLGRRAVRACFARQVAEIVEEGRRRLGEVPVILGEVGIPYDLGRKRAFAGGDYRVQEEALDASLAAVEASLADYAIWCWSPDNDNAWGDQWNDEDFSIYSRDGAPDRSLAGAADYEGGRALRAALRPYARALAGDFVEQGFELRRSCYRLIFRPDSTVRAPSEIFLPRLHYGRGIEVELSAGTWDYEPEAQVLSLRLQEGLARSIEAAGGAVRLLVRPARGPDGPRHDGPRPDGRR